MRMRENDSPVGMCLRGQLHLAFALVLGVQVLPFALCLLHLGYLPSSCRS